GSLFLGVSALAGVHVRGIPVPPVMRRGHRLKRAVMLGRLVQELSQAGNVLELHIHDLAPLPVAQGPVPMPPVFAIGALDPHSAPGWPRSTNSYQIARETPMRGWRLRWIPGPGNIQAAIRPRGAAHLMMRADSTRTLTRS